MRKSFSAELMAKVALDAIKEEKTIAELSSQYETHRTQITNWRKRALEGLVWIFPLRIGGIDSAPCTVIGAVENF